MVSDETVTAVHDLDCGDTSIHFMPDGGGDDDDKDHIGYRRMSRLSIESSGGGDADAELSGEEEEEEEVATLRGTPLRGPPGRAAKEYASERVAGGRRGRRRRRAREWWLQRAWEMKKRAWEVKKRVATAEGLGGGGGGGGGECKVLVRRRGGVGTMCMDMEEVKACRDLGLELPVDWTVEIPCALSGSTADTSSGGNSPIANWRISSPGKSDDPEDVKARLKVWAQAVALASASGFSGCLTAI